MNLSEIDKIINKKKHKILVAVSGGIDSMTLLHLLVSQGFDCGVAHCNFKLRGKESDGDEKFVEYHSKKYDVPFFTKSFRTKQYAKEYNASIQVAARELRYKWFEEIRAKYQYDFIATAHTSNDNIETFFINIIRGTGIKGLSGIKLLSGKIIRPLINTSRKEITEYGIENKVEYREDSSNREDKYTRNKIRHKLLPLLESINPGIENTIIENIRRFEFTEHAFLEQIHKIKESVIDNKKEIRIDKHFIKGLDFPAYYLYEIIENKGFNFTQCKDIVASINSVGKQVISSTHIALIDRNELLISEKAKNSLKEITIPQGKFRIKNPINITGKIEEYSSNFLINKSKNFCYVDADKLKFPLILRKWSAGDRFQPLGMKGKKNVSDFLIDLKVPRNKKELVYILESGDKIVCIPGYRTDEKFKITSATKKVLIIECKSTE